MESYQPLLDSKIAAYHEAGHALVGFWVRLQPTKISIHEAEDGLFEGRTVYEYGDDEKYLVRDDSGGFTGVDRENCLHFLIRRYKALMGGPHAEARLKKGEHYNHGGVRLVTRDLELQVRLSKKYKACTGHEIDPLRHIEKEAADYVNKYWEAVECLAESVLSSPNFELGKEEIASILIKFDLNKT